VIRRPGPEPVPEPVPDAVRLARLTARHDQALAIVGEQLHRAGSNRQLADALLDIRNALQPPPPGSLP
jgi:hypothetical protein